MPDDASAGEPGTTSAEASAGASAAAGLHDALGSIVDAAVEVERLMASLAAVRSRLVEQAVEVAGVAETAAGTREARRRDLAFRSVRAELATALRWSERAAERLMQTSVGLGECPATLAALTAGGISYRHAELVAEQARTIDEPAARATFDVVAAGLAAHLNPPRFAQRVRELRERMHPEPAERRHRRALEERCVRLEPAADGMAWLSAFLPAVEALAIHDRLTRIARVQREEGVDGRPVDGSDLGGRDLEQLRADLFRDLLLDAPVDERAEAQRIDVGRFRGIRPNVVVTVPAMTLLRRPAEEPPVVEGYGPVDEATARELAANAPAFRRLLTHPHTGVRLDLGREQYRIPPELRMWLRVRDGSCRFPGCGRPAGTCDLDHTEDWAHGGASRSDNLASLCRTHHMLKHHSSWSMRQEGDGTISWTSPLGRVHRTEPAHRLLAREDAREAVRAGPGP